MTLFVITWVGADGEPAQTEQQATTARQALRAFRAERGRREILGISSAGGGVRVAGAPPVAWTYDLGTKPWPDLKFECDGESINWIMSALTVRGEAWATQNVGPGRLIDHELAHPLMERARHQGLLVYGGA
jgi:hypothetical protein